MAVLPLCTAPHPCLSTATEFVESIDDDILQLLEDMVATMYANNGIGLAANQIGVAKRLAVIDLDEDLSQANLPQPLKLINPQLIWASPQRECLVQGCLSVPEQYCEITRSVEVRVKYIDESGNTKEIHGKGLMAHCLQHEIDHLDGTLIIDHLSPLKRKMALSKLAKIRNRSEIS